MNRRRPAGERERRHAHWRWALLPALLAGLLLLVVPAVQGAPAPATPDLLCSGEHWVATWTAAPQGSSLGRPDDAAFGEADGLARSFEDQTLRMIITPSSAGSALRVRFGNRFGTAPVTVTSATVGVREHGAAAVPGSLRPLTFGGSRAVVVPAFGEAVSDPVPARVEALRDLIVSFHVDGRAVLDHHQWAVSTQYATPSGSGDHSQDGRADAFTEELGGWYGVTGADVLTPRAIGAVVTLGDSITDGVGSSPDASRRWPDRLAQRVAASGAPFSIVNAGIAGNHVLTSGLGSATAIGPSARDRLDFDVIRLAGVTDVLVFAGINDIFMAAPEHDVVPSLIDGHRAIAERARAAGLRVVGATITPASLARDDEAARQRVNQWIRASGVYDSVVDFDAVARDPADPTRLRPEWDAGMAHLNDAGYLALADAVDLDAFRGTGC